MEWRKGSGCAVDVYKVDTMDRLKFWGGGEVTPNYMGGAKPTTENVSERAERVRG